MPKTLAIDPIKEAEAAKALLASIGATAGEDGQLLIDMVEGETSLFEAFDALLDGILQDTAQIEAIDRAVGRLATRSVRFQKRVATAKTLIEQAFAIAEIDGKIERPIATLFMSKRAPKVEIITESDIPSQFWKASDPVLDKKALGEALKARQAALAALADMDEPQAKAAAIEALPPEIPGVVLSNAAPTLSVRFS